jgi:uncharacterized Zn finger protein
MSKSRIAPIEYPRCPNCTDRMELVRSAPIRSGFDVRTFECTRCGQAKIVETRDPLNEAQGWLIGPALRRPE